MLDGLMRFRERLVGDCAGDGQGMDGRATGAAEGEGSGTLAGVESSPLFSVGFGAKVSYFR